MANERALRLLAERRHQDACEYLAAAVQQFPEDPELRLHYATSLLAVRPERAADQAIKGVDLDPDEPVRLTRAASLLFNRGETEKARSYAARAKELTETDFLFYPELLNLDGHFADLDGEDDRAEECFRGAFEREPSGEIFAFDLAKFMAERGRRDEALAIIGEGLMDAKRPEPLERLRSELLEEADPHSAE